MQAAYFPKTTKVTCSRTLPWIDAMLQMAMLLEYFAYMLLNKSTSTSFGKRACIPNNCTVS